MIHLIVGNTGSGKTTYSKKLKTEISGIIFSIDAWNNALFLPDKMGKDGLEWFLERIDRAESVISELIVQLESSGVDSILDLGLSKFSHREKFRKFASYNQFEVKMHFLDIPQDVRKERVLKRNNEKGETYEFEVTANDFEFMEGWFEKPNENELENGVTIIE
jgi:predicted kinase